MIVTVVSFKGGVGKTTTAIHLAAYLHRLSGSTVLLDGDPNRAALAWNRHGTLPFPVADINETAKLARLYTNIVIDTEARPGPNDFKALAQGCDLLVIPTVPGTLDTLALTETLNALREMGKAIQYRVLLTMVPTGEPEAVDLRNGLVSAGVPLFASEIPHLKAFERAAAQGVAVFDVKDPRAAKAWAAYEAAGKELS